MPCTHYLKPSLFQPYPSGELSPYGTSPELLQLEPQGRGLVEARGLAARKLFEPAAYG
jgi:hypothetical protein